MGDVEPESRAQRVLFVLCTEHPLGYVATASGFCSWIPCQPPLQAEINDECEDRDGPHRTACQALAEVGQKRSWIGGCGASRLNIALNRLQMHLQRLHPAKLCHRNPG